MDKCNSGIYKIKNLKNNKLYIGSSVDIKGRILNHKRFLKNNKHCNSYLQRAYNNSEEFEYSIVEYCDRSELLHREEHYINLYMSNVREYGYNLGSFKQGRKIHSQETRLKIGMANRGKKRTGELTQLQRDSITAAGKRPKSIEHRKKISLAHIGKKRQPFSEEWLNKMSNAGSKYWNLYDDSNNLILECSKTKDVAKFIGVHYTSVLMGYKENRLIIKKYRVEEVERSLK